MYITYIYIYIKTYIYMKIPHMSCELTVSNTHTQSAHIQMQGMKKKMNRIKPHRIGLFIPKLMFAFVP